MDAALKHLTQAIRNEQWDVDLTSLVNQEWTTESCRDLTLALADSTAAAQRIRPEDWPEGTTDLATTGGLTLKSSLVVSTWLARAGHRVPKIATTGSSGTGTIDLLHHLRLNTALEPNQLRSQVSELGLAFCDSTYFAPADSKLMRLRREQGCMKVQPLVIASILAKKVALGLSRFTVEIRAGQESKFGDYRATLEGARRLVEVAEAMGLEVLAVVTNGDLLAAHGTGAALLAHECMRHLKGYPDAEEGESGLLWDRSHRQALELFCLAHWWSRRDSATADRAWLRSQIGQWTTELENSHELFWKVAAAQGSRLSEAPPLPRFRCEFPLEGTLWELQPAALDSLAPKGARLSWHIDEALLSASVNLSTISEASELPGATLLAAFRPDGPLPLDENVLVATVGTAGGVVTETVDRLFFEHERVDRVVVIHTRSTLSMKEIEKVRLDLAPRSSEEFTGKEVQEALKDENKPLVFPMLPVQRPFAERLPLESSIVDFEDLYDREANQQAFDRILLVLHREDNYRNLHSSQGKLWVLAAGGRKTMSAMAYFASMLFNTTATYHVLLGKNVKEQRKVKGEAYFHVPPDQVILVDMPELHLSNLVDLAARRQVRRDQLNWSELVAQADDELKLLLAQSAKREDEARDARKSLEEILGAPPFLPKELQLVLVGDAEGILKFRLEQHLKELVSIKLAQNLEDVDHDCDVVVIGESQVNSELLNFSLATTLPILSLTPRAAADKRQVDAFLLQRSHAYQWVDCDSLQGLEVALVRLLLGSGAERCEADLKINGELTSPKDQVLLKRLFAGRAEKHLDVKVEGSGQSQAKKLWICADGKPRRYFVKVAPYQSCFQEFCNYRKYVNGRADNYSGRIDWFPARDVATSAIAYTEIGIGKAQTARSEMLPKLSHLAATWEEVILDRIHDFHGKTSSETVSDSLVQKHLNPFLPADEYHFNPNGSKIGGRLYEVNPEKGRLQLLQADGQRVNIDGCKSQELVSLRLHLNRPLSIPADLKLTWKDKLTNELKRVAPDLSLKSALDDLWRCLMHHKLEVGNIHGDLNLDNIMLDWDINSNLRQAWLIDFAMTRKGPVDYDFAKLEVELWTQLGSLLIDQGLSSGPESMIAEVYEGKPDGQLGDFKKLILSTGKTCQAERPVIYNRMRAVYALSTLKFGNLNDRQKRFGALLFQRFMKG